ncbi:MAG: rhomboid family intramembrane serine protease [Oscillospiraceae bacterium]
MNWVNKLERKFGRFGIPNLMFCIVVLQFVVFAADLILRDNPLSSLLSLNMAMVAKGQVWRLFTFLFLPQSTNILFIFLTLYFYYMIGGALENEWGSFGFTLFYLVGWLATVVSALFTGYGFNLYLNFSLLFAFAVLFPDFEVMLFFFIPTKMKYLAIFNAVFYVVEFIRNGAAVRGSILASLLSLLLFFGGDFMRMIKRNNSYRATRKNFRKQMNEWNDNTR